MSHLEYDDNRGPGKPPKYPFRKLGVGETVFLPGAMTRLVGKAGADYRPMRFRCKTVIKNGVIGTRLWRIA